MSTFITNKYDSINLVCVMMESAASYPMNRFQFSIRSGMESGIASIATSRYLYSMQGERTVYVISSSRPTTTRRPLEWTMLMVNFGVPSRRSLIVGSAQTAKSSTSARPSSTSIGPGCSLNENSIIADCLSSVFAANPRTLHHNCLWV